MRVELKKRHNRLNTTAVYVTHDQVEAMTLGDRVAVMEGGVVQQVGEPLELYNSPVNRFVAGFIGSPAMNFAAVRLYDAGGLPHADSDGFSIDVPAEFTPRLRRYAGGDVTMGIRPEDLQLANDSHPPGFCFDAVVELVERLGAEDSARPADRPTIHGGFGGPDSARQARRKASLRVTPRALALLRHRIRSSSSTSSRRCGCRGSLPCRR